MPVAHQKVGGRRSAEGPYRHPGRPRSNHRYEPASTAKAAAGVMAMAFLDDPTTMWLLPDETSRERRSFRLAGRRGRLG